MTMKILAGQTHTVTGYPFVHYVANLYDEDDGCPYQTEGWRPGCSREVDENPGGYFPEEHYVADGTGAMVLEVVATFKPGRFPERVFYTRRWIDPDGREFGKTGKLRIATTGQFRRLLGGYRLIPIEPTEDMLRAMTDPFVAINGDNRKAFEIAYTAMLAAAQEAKP